MRIDEYRSKIIGEQKLVLVGFDTKLSNYNGKEQIVFYFTDKQNRIWVHYQLVKSEACDLQIRKWFVNLGFNMSKREPIDLYYDFNNVVYKKDGRVKDTQLGKALGRVYLANIVKRKMQWTDKSGKKVRKTFFDVDSVVDTFSLKQDVMIKQFKEASTLPNGENIYEWWCGRNFEIDTKFDDLGKDNSYGIIPTWELKEEEILGSV